MFPTEFVSVMNYSVPKLVIISFGMRLNCHMLSMTTTASHFRVSPAPVIIQIITGAVAANIMMGLSFFLLAGLSAGMISITGSAFSDWHVAIIGLLYAAIVFAIGGVVFMKARARSSHAFAWTWIIFIALDLIPLLIGWSLYFVAEPTDAISISTL